MAFRLSLAAAAAFACATPAAAQTAPDFETGVLAEINFAREHPHDYAEELRAYRDRFDGNVVRAPGDENGIYTREGVRAVDEAIAFLEAQAPLPPLAPGDLLGQSARYHAGELGASGTTGHVSPDGANPGDRVRRMGGDIFVGETISYGAGDASAVVRGFIVDDGVPARGHRTAIFSTGYRFAGVGRGPHARYGVTCVVDYSGTATGAPMLPASLKGASTFVWRGARSGSGAVASAR
ncbi:CAP domain-containing protein [Sphingomonas sp.]|uniref:CAP domain-containing protein n=1 Tax=Sphingomonas sp. TaxID=28214 RepID=UPI001B0168B9|nr:CAP domain-containing protein [Sphingomonas sp.]MBO9712146.1 CAP domain-containing protein [Sphingomonas sp.]